MARLRPSLPNKPRGRRVDVPAANGPRKTLFRRVAIRYDKLAATCDAAVTRELGKTRWIMSQVLYIGDLVRPTAEAAAEARGPRVVSYRQRFAKFGLQQRQPALVRPQPGREQPGNQAGRNVRFAPISPGGDRSASGQ